MAKRKKGDSENSEVRVNNRLLEMEDSNTTIEDLKAIRRYIG
jgi:hypothetical protein